jgi:uncharacterized protein YndB with AHSA1/START domain
VRNVNRGWFSIVALGGLLAGCSSPAAEGVDVQEQEQAMKLPGDDDAALPPRTAGKWSVVFEEQAVIAAPVDRIWDILTDLPKYAEWNPWIPSAEGDLEPGGIVWCDVMLGQKKQRAKHVVLVVEPKTHLCWRDAGWNSAFVYGQRCRTLTPRSDGTVLFQQELLIDGLLSKVASLTYGASLRDGLRTETAALKQRAEATP